MKIAFHSNQLCLRGTEVALFDYAYYNQAYLNNESIIISNKNNPASHPEVIKKFENIFRVFFYEDFKEVEDILDQEHVDIMYMIKAGFNDGLISKKHKTVIHCVFTHYEPHGNVYAYISPWLARHYNNIWVPHMINIPINNISNLRDELNIPQTAIVFGRHGGDGQFDIDFVRQCVYDIARTRSDIYFLFMNTNKFCPDHRQIIHLPGTADMIKKAEFINTGDAMLYGRASGESFGIAIGEFSVFNKPIICPSFARDSFHLETLGNKAIKYSNYQELYKVLTNFKPMPDQNWNCYQEFTPENVITKFKQVFID